MTRFDLEQTYLSLDGRGGVATHPVEGFWETVDSNPAIKENLVGVYAGKADWPHWEMHPNGDEVLVLLEGSMTMLFERADGETRRELTAGSTLIVPAGTWHRALISAPTKLLGITYGSGTQHKPVD